MSIRIIFIALALAFGATFINKSCEIRAKAIEQSSKKEDRKPSKVSSLKSVAGPKKRAKSDSPSASKSKSVSKPKTYPSQRKSSKTTPDAQTTQPKVDTTATDSVVEKKNIWINFRASDSKPKEVRPNINPIYKVEAVDLGLGVEWADRNLGADKPEDLGNYFAWGEIQPKTSFKWSNYLEGQVSSKDDCGTDKDPLKKFVYPYSRDLPYNYDAATMSLGGDWRMPTKVEILELVQECEWEWVEKDGIAGSKVTGPNGNSIFIPATGWSDSENYDRINNVGYEGFYWTATASFAYPESAYLFHNFNGKDDKGVDARTTEIRFVGQTIRAVRSK